MAEKYTPETEAEVLGWLQATTGAKIAPGMQSVHEALKDGRVLIQCAYCICICIPALHACVTCIASSDATWCAEARHLRHLVQNPVPARRHMNKLLEGTPQMPPEVSKIKVPIKINTMQAPFKQVRCDPTRCSLPITVAHTRAHTSTSAPLAWPSQSTSLYSLRVH